MARVKSRKWKCPHCGYICSVLAEAPIPTFCGMCKKNPAIPRTPVPTLADTERFQQILDLLEGQGFDVAEFRDLTRVFQLSDIAQKMIAGAVFQADGNWITLGTRFTLTNELRAVLNDLLPYIRQPTADAPAVVRELIIRLPEVARQQDVEPPDSDPEDAPADFEFLNEE